MRLASFFHVRIGSSVSLKSGVCDLLHRIEKRDGCGVRRELPDFYFLLDGMQHFGYVLHAQAADLFVDRLPVANAVSLYVVP